MTQEDKELLIKDICARIPYDLVCFVQSKNNPKILSEKEKFSYDMLGIYMRLINEESHIVKPYLRPMSSMTEEEKEELRLEHEKDERLFLECINKSKQGDNSMRGKVITHFASDWCNKNHFDYRGLIEKGLALEALEGMYNTKQ